MSFGDSATAAAVTEQKPLLGNELEGPEFVSVVCLLTHKHLTKSPNDPSMFS